MRASTTSRNSQRRTLNNIYISNKVGRINIPNGSDDAAERNMIRTNNTQNKPFYFNNKLTRMGD